MIYTEGVPQLKHGRMQIADYSSTITVSSISAQPRMLLIARHIADVMTGALQRQWRKEALIKNITSDGFYEFTQYNVMYVHVTVCVHEK